MPDNASSDNLGGSSNDSNAFATRAGLQSWVDSQFGDLNQWGGYAGSKSQQGIHFYGSAEAGAMANDPKRTEQDLANLKQYFTNDGAGDVFQQGKQTYDRVLAALTDKYGDAAKAKKTLDAMHAMYNDEALTAFRRTYGLKDASQFDSPDAYAKYLKDSGLGDGTVTDSIKNAYTAMGWDADAAQKAVDEQHAQGINREKITSELQDFADRLGKPIMNADGSTSDPVLSQLMGKSREGDLMDSSSRGIQGPAASQAAQDSALAAATPYLANRDQLYGQALGALKNNQLTNEQLNQQATQINAGINAQNNDVLGNIFSGKMSTAQAIGAGAGAIGGGIAGYYTGNIAGGAKAGASLGAGAGGAIYNATNNPGYQSYTPYTYKSGLGGSN